MNDIKEHIANVTAGVASLKPVTDDPSNPPVFKKKKSPKLLRDIVKRTGGQK